MVWDLETMSFVVIMISAACGGLMALVGLVCEIVRMTPWYIKHHEKMTVKMAESIIDENYINYVCPDCRTWMQFSDRIERYCSHCGREITEEEMEKYEKV